MDNINHISERASRKLTWLMCLCSVFIVLWHSNGYKYFSLDTSFKTDNAIMMFIDVLQKRFFPMALPTFFFFTAFLLYRDLSQKNILVKMKRRVKTLIVPYLVWNVIWMLFLAAINLFPQIISRIDSLEMFELSVKNLLLGIFLYKYNGVYWYMYNIIIFMIFCPVIYMILKNKKVGLIAILVILICYISNNQINFLDLRNEGILFYFIGSYLGIHYNNLLEFKFNKICHWLFALCFLVICWTGESNYMFFELVRKMFMILTIWVILDIPKLLHVKWWMNTYFFIYSFHRITQQCINKILKLFLPNNGIGALINFIGGFIITILIGIFLAKFLIIYLPKLWCILNGYRTFAIQMKRGEKN